MCRLLLLLGCLYAATASANAGLEGADVSHGLQIFSKVVRQYLSSQPEDLRVGQGVHIVSTDSINDARSNRDDGSLLGIMENYLHTHEIRIKLPELMPGDGFGRAFKDAMDGYEANEIGTGRGKGGGFGGGKGGGGMGGVLLMGAMMGKMMAALGLGGVGLLAMKALMVSALALMLSLIVGLKKLVSSDHDDGGGHTVIHASPSHGGGGYEHRRKRAAADMAYASWNEFQTS